MGAEKERVGEGKALVVQIEYSMEGAHFIRDGVHQENIHVRESLSGEDVSIIVGTQ